MIGSIAASRLANRFSRVAIIFVSTAALAVSITLPVIALRLPHAIFPIMAAHSFTWGLAMVVSNIQVAALVAERVPHAILGRVASLRRTLSIGVVPFGAIIGGIIGVACGVPAVLWVVIALVLAATAITFPPCLTTDQ